MARGVKFEAWVYHPTERSDGPADRLAVENGELSGYGFCLTNGGKSLWIERRDKKHPVTLKEASVDLVPDRWYRFSLTVESDALLYLDVFDEDKTQVASIDPVEDRTYKSFDRIAIHGGGPYFVRDVSIKQLETS